MQGSELGPFVTSISFYAEYLVRRIYGAMLGSELGPRVTSLTFQVVYLAG